jgi:streptogramin lyase
VWVAGSSGLKKLDPLTGDELGSTAVGSPGFGETASVAVGDDAVWYASSSGQTLSKVDLQSAATAQTFTVGNGPSGIAIGEGAVWVANSRDGTLSRVDPEHGQPRSIGIGQPTGGVVAAYGSVWTSPGQPRS